LRQKQAFYCIFHYFSTPELPAGQLESGKNKGFLKHLSLVAYFKQFTQGQALRRTAELPLGSNISITKEFTPSCTQPIRT
jgi:hypothetical protein